MADPPIRLVAFDMEGCLTDDPTVWEIMHRKVGTWHSHGLRYWERYRAGELDYDRFARLDVAAWRGAPVSLLEEAADEVPLMPGCAALLGALREAGIHVAVISNGLTHVTRRFRTGFGVRHTFANAVVTDGRGRLTGGLQVRVPYDGKGAVLRALARRLGVPRSRIAAVGDSPSDIALFEESALAIAFRPTHPSVAASAAHVVSKKDLAAVRDLLAL